MIANWLLVVFVLAAMFAQASALRGLGRRTTSLSLSTPRRFLSMSAVSYKTGVMFPGQGAQAVGMAGPLCAELPEAKALFDKASEILGYDLLKVCVEGPKEKLDSTVVAQVAIFVSSMAALEKLKKDDPAAIESCTVTMGLSLGEYTALCFAGAFSFEDGVKLTKVRGEAMQAAADASKSGMVAIVGLDIATVNAICAEATKKSGKPIAIANYLVDGNYAVSGAIEACDAAREVAPAMGARMAVPLAVAGAFHTDFMQPAVPTLEKALASVTINTPRIPVISNVDAKPHTDAASIRATLAKQVTNPVQWETIVSTMVKDPEFTKAYEVGPGTVCRGIVKRFGKKLEVINVSA